MVTLASLRVCKGELPFEGGFTSSHEGICASTQKEIVEVPVRDFACGGRSKRRNEIGSIHAIESWWNGVEDAVRVAVPAYWASWADCIPMIFNRHPDVANLFVHELEGTREGALGAAAEAKRAVTGVLGFDPPTWEDLAHGARPPPAEPEDMEPWSGRGWQHVAASKVEFQHREELFTHMGPSHRV